MTLTRSQSNQPSGYPSPSRSKTTRRGKPCSCRGSIAVRGRARYSRRMENSTMLSQYQISRVRGGDTTLLGSVQADNCDDASIKGSVEFANAIEGGDTLLIKDEAGRVYLDTSIIRTHVPWACLSYTDQTDPRAGG